AAEPRGPAVLARRRLAGHRVRRLHGRRRGPRLPDRRAPGTGEAAGSNDHPGRSPARLVPPLVLWPAGPPSAESRELRDGPGAARGADRSAPRAGHLEPGRAEPGPAPLGDRGGVRDLLDDRDIVDRGGPGALVPRFHDGTDPGP